MDADNASTLFGVTNMEIDRAPTSTNDKIDTSVIPKLRNIHHQLADEFVALSKTPYSGLFGEGSLYFHDDLRTVTRIVACLNAGGPVDLNQLAKDGLSKETWSIAFSSLYTNQYDSDRMEAILIAVNLHDSDVETVKVVMSRLSYTSPLKLFGIVTKSQVDYTNASCAWFAAQNTLGSAYSKLTPIQTKLSFTPGTKPGTLAQIVLDTSTHDPTTTVNPTTKSSNDIPSLPTPKPSGPSPSNQQIPTPTPMQTEDTITIPPALPTQPAVPTPPSVLHETRFLAKIKVVSTNNVSPNVVILRKLKEWYTTAREEDSTVVILPWAIQSSEKRIDDPETFPDSIKAFNTYAPGLNVRDNKDIWFKIRFGHDTHSDNISSNRDSSIAWWHEKNQSGAYPCAVQDSDNTIILGQFLYSGLFINPARCDTIIKSLWSRAYPKLDKLKMGCKNVKCKEIKLPQNQRFSIMNQNNIISLEVDKNQSQDLKRLLHLAFNKQEDRSKRPGFYDFRMLPAPDLMTSGANGKTLRLGCLKKHEGVLKNLELIRTPDIRHLDEAIVSAGKQHSLRSVLMNITWPIVEPPSDPSDTTTKKLIYLVQSVDMAPFGNDLNDGIAYLTAYRDDRSTILASLVAILPAYIDMLLGRNAVAKWFHPIALSQINDVDFILDDGGNWTGKWITADDQAQQEFIDEDLGFEINIEGLQLLDTLERPPVTFTTDDASVNTFGAEFGTPGGIQSPHIDQQGGASVSSPPVAVEAAAAPGSGGPTA
jgi:hypothetical protein